MSKPYLARFDATGLEGYLDKYPFEPDETVLCLGEIENMPGHVVLAKKDGRVFWGYHPENFPKIPDEELFVTFFIPFDSDED